MEGRRTGRLTVLIEISPGELIDKMTILEIKAERIVDADKLRRVRSELDALSSSYATMLPRSAELTRLTNDLKAVNALLWDVENLIRGCEATKEFGPQFVDLARLIYRHNDRRSMLKYEINELLGSSRTEVKDYQPYH